MTGTVTYPTTEPTVEDKVETARIGTYGGYRMCVRCVMDTSDRDITFDASGVCNHCHTFAQYASRRLKPLSDRTHELDRVVQEMKLAGKGREYDCILGVSGGVDSTYAAYLLRKLGLRVLAVHVDNGWNSELAVFNIERVLRTLGIDLHTEVLDWEEFKDLQLSFLKASVPDGEIPTDHAIFAVMHAAPERFGCRYVVNGVNSSSEALLPITWTYGVSDWTYITAIQKRFGTVRLRSFPHFRLWSHYLKRVVRRHHSISILDLVDYRKEEAKRLLEKELGWRDYGGKHYESIYTRFFQGYILPRKFGIDKRRSHLSSLICAGQLSREAALEELAGPPYDPTMQRDDREYVLKKFGLTDAQFDDLMGRPTKTFEQYPNSLRYLPFLRALARPARRLGLLRSS
jgi:N-acetyl sugar amidotransferase